VPWSESVVVRDGVRLFCRDAGGPGPPVVLLHGLAGTSGEWEGVAGLLRPGFRVVAFDQRGQGRSERRPEDVSRAAYVADVIAVLDRLGLARTVLVGQSLGGHTAMLTAAAHPERVAALVLVEAGPGGSDQEGPERIGRWLDSWPVPFASRAEAAEFFGGGAVGAGWAWGLEERDGLRPAFERDVLVRSLDENARRSYWDEWESVACPALAVFAEESFLPAREIEEMLRRRPATRAVSVPGTVHDLHLQRPAALHRALAGFLDEVRGESG
jgi:pimeloyl-ACP methyl ester carboxylesterase